MLKIKEWTDVDKAIEQIGMLDIRIGELSSGLGRKLYELLGEYSESAAGLKDERSHLASAIESFCLLNKGEFAIKRSKQLHFGKIACRMAERIEVPEELENAAIATLKKLGYLDCIEIKERLDRNALKKLSDSDLTRCGIRRIREDHFRIDPDLNLVSKKLGHKEFASPPFSIDLQRLDKALKRRDEAAAEDSTRAA